METFNILHLQNSSSTNKYHFNILKLITIFRLILLSVVTINSILGCAVSFLEVENFSSYIGSFISLIGFGMLFTIFSVSQNYSSFVIVVNEVCSFLSRLLSMLY